MGAYNFDIRLYPLAPTNNLQGAFTTVRETDRRERSALFRIEQRSQSTAFIVSTEKFLWMGVISKDALEKISGESTDSLRKGPVMGLSSLDSLVRETGGNFRPIYFLTSYPQSRDQLVGYKDHAIQLRNIILEILKGSTDPRGTDFKKQTIFYPIIEGDGNDAEQVRRLAVLMRPGPLKFHVYAGSQNPKFPIFSYFPEPVKQEEDCMPMDIDP